MLYARIESILDPRKAETPALIEDASYVKSRFE